MHIPNLPAIHPKRPAWNKGRFVGQKRPLLPKHVWAIRVRLEIAEAARDLALFNMAIDSKLRGCDLVRLKVAVSFYLQLATMSGVLTGFDLQAVDIIGKVVWSAFTLD